MHIHRPSNNNLSSLSSIPPSLSLSHPSVFTFLSITHTDGKGSEPANSRSASFTRELDLPLEDHNHCDQTSCGFLQLYHAKFTRHGTQWRIQKSSDFDRLHYISTVSNGGSGLHKRRQWPPTSLPDVTTQHPQNHRYYAGHEGE